MTEQNRLIHETVREHYGAIARTRGSSCCGSQADTVSLDSIGVEAQSCCDDNTHASSLYNDETIAGLPVDVTGMSLGCGDPVTIAGLQPGETVLDLGSGGGIDCFLAARQVGEAGFVIGVDMTADMLARANANKAKLGVQNVEFREGQIEQLPVDDSSIDVIMSNCVINLSPDKPSVFREALRVLKPGGRVSISDIVTEGEFSDELRSDASKWAGCVYGAIDAKEYIGMMQAAGFVDVTVREKVEVSGSRLEAGEPRIYSARITAYKPQQS